MYVNSIRFRFFFFKQKTAYELRISYWSSDVCSSDLLADSVKPVNQDGEVSEFRSAGVEEIWSPIQARKFTVEAELVLLEGIQARLASRLAGDYARLAS